MSDHAKPTADRPALLFRKDEGAFLLPYCCAAVSIAVATWFRLALDPCLGMQFPFATPLFAVLLTSWYGGFRPALVAVVLGALSATYFLLPPRGQFVPEGMEQQVGLVLYCGLGLGIALLGGVINPEGKIVLLNAQTEKLRRLNAELEQGAHQLGEVNRELKARTQENEAFVYSVSHDLRAPLVNLQGFSRELSRAVQDLRNHLREPELPQSIRDRQLGVLDGPMARSIHFIQTAVTRLGNIIDALLRLSLAGQVIYQRQRVDVQAIVAHVIASLRGTAEERGAILATGDLPPALGDPFAIEQVFANLIGNALNYLDSKRTGQIEVGNLGLDRDNSQLSIYYIQDNGLGITETGRAKIFQPFQRLHPQTAAGVGMGLAIVQRVIERHGGKIWFESTAGQGSTFFVALPASPIGESPASLPSASPAFDQRSQRE